MEKFKFVLQRNLLILIVLCWIYIVVLYLWSINSSYDPFYLSRLGVLNSNIDFFDASYFLDVPYTYFYNVVLGRLLGIEIIENGFIPLVQLISFFSLLLFGKVLYQKFNNPYRSLYFIVSLSVFITLFLIILPYQEYYIGYALYPLFLWSFFNYTNKKTYQFAILLILIFMTMHFFAIPMSAWVVQFIVGYFILLFFSKFLSKSNNLDKFAISTTFIALILVIFLFWNYKFFHSLEMNSFNLNTMVDLVKDLIYPSGSFSNFQYVPKSSNIIAIWGGRINLILTYIPIALVFLYEFSKKNIFFFIRSREDIFIIALMFPFIIEFFIYGSSGLLNFRYSALIFPFISYFYVLKYLSKNSRAGKGKLLNYFKTHKKQIINIYLILLVICSLIVVNSQLSNTSTSFPLESADAISDWYPQYVKNDSNLVTDFSTESYFQYYLKSKDRKYLATRILFSDNVYSYLIGENNNASSVKNLQFVMVNNKNLNKGISQGPPGWVTLEPLSFYIDKINSNFNINLIYDSNLIKIYKRRGT